MQVPRRPRRSGPFVLALFLAAGGAGADDEAMPPVPQNAADRLEPDVTVRRGSRGYADFRGRDLTLGFRLQLLQEEGSGLSVRRGRASARADLNPRLQLYTSVGANTGSRLDWLDWILKWRTHDRFRVWMGQFKSALSRSSMGSSGSISFTDRPLPVRTFVNSNVETDGSPSLGRLQGHGVGRLPSLQVWGDLDAHRHRNLRYVLQVMKGHRANELGDGRQATFRLEIQPRGDPGAHQTAFRVRPTRYSLDLAIHQDRSLDLVDLDGDGLRSPADLQDRRILSAGGVFRRRRFRLQGEVFSQRSRPRSLPLPTKQSLGRYLQMSWLLEPRIWQVALRQAENDPDRSLGGDHQRERALAFTRYLRRGRGDKWILEWNRLTDAFDPDRDRTRWNLMLQVRF